MEVEHIQQLLTLTDRFEKIERLVYRTGEDRRENDVEHTYSLAMAAWFFALELNKKQQRNLDIQKMLLYVLVHDLVEAYAGDTDSLSHSGLEGKHEREAEGLSLLKKDTEFFPEIVTLIEEYEQQENEEAIFIKSFDKLMPVFKNLRDQGRSFKDFHQDVDFESWIAFKEQKIKDKDVFKLWLETRKQVEEKGFLPKK